MEGTTSTVVLRTHQKDDAGSTPPAANQNVDPLENGKLPNIANDDWLVALLSSLWHSRDQSAETREIVESKVNEKEAEITHNLFRSMPAELRSELQKHTTLYLDRAKDNLGQYMPGWLDGLRAGPLMLKRTTSVGFYVKGCLRGERPTWINRLPHKSPIDPKKTP